MTRSAIASRFHSFACASPSAERAASAGNQPGRFSGHWLSPSAARGRLSRAGEVVKALGRRLLPTRAVGPGRLGRGPSWPCDASNWPTGRASAERQSAWMQVVGCGSVDRRYAAVVRRGRSLGQCRSLVMLLWLRGCSLGSLGAANDSSQGANKTCRLLWDPPRESA